MRRLTACRPKRRPCRVSRRWAAIAIRLKQLLVRHPHWNLHGPSEWLASSIPSAKIKHAKSTPAIYAHAGNPFNVGRTSLRTSGRVPAPLLGVQLGAAAPNVVPAKGVGNDFHGDQHGLADSGRTTRL